VVRNALLPHSDIAGDSETPSVNAASLAAVVSPTSDSAAGAAAAAAAVSDMQYLSVTGTGDSRKLEAGYWK